jgi:hypothetical protein
MVVWEVCIETGVSLGINIMMIDETVFVLGAGASVEFGFPLGQGLTEFVIQSTATNVDHRKRLVESGICSQEHIYLFHEALQYSGRNSVDAFLEHRTEFLDVGKAAMALALRSYENLDQLLNFRNNWLRYIYDHMNCAFDDFGSNKVAFVTFNYDRSVEQFFYLSLLNSYGKSPDEVLDQLNKIPIIHLHGRLAYLPWQKQMKGISEYSATLSNDHILNGINNIKVIHEQVPADDVEFQQARQLPAPA